MRIKINRLFHGLASLRDYQVKKALETGEDLEILLAESGEIMIIPFSEIENKIKRKNDDIFKSKHNSEYYKLWDFEWRPETRQAKLFQK